ncbi:MAG: hypothetical protein IPL78_00765 [Chloroflexi bacterium]|nr:hypothetical protein [Chloroflexota bacterium]
MLPAQNTLYYSKPGSLYQAELDSSGQTELVWLGNQRYYGVTALMRRFPGRLHQAAHFQPGLWSVCALCRQPLVARRSV